MHGATALATAPQSTFASPGLGPASNADRAPDFRRTRPRLVSTVQSRDTRQCLPGPRSAAPGVHVDAGGNLLAGRRHPALVPVPHGQEVVNPLRVEVEQQQGEIERIAELELT